MVGKGDGEWTWQRHNLMGALLVQASCLLSSVRSMAFCCKLLVCMCDWIQSNGTVSDSCLKLDVSWSDLLVLVRYYYLE